jgi:hypothetical protein
MTALWPYTARPSLYRLPGERIPPWACQCAGLKRWERHREPHQCVTKEEVRAWRSANPKATCSDLVAKCLVWMASEFAP